MPKECTQFRSCSTCLDHYKCGWCYDQRDPRNGRYTFNLTTFILLFRYPILIFVVKARLAIHPLNKLVLLSILVGLATDTREVRVQLPR